ncbi:AAA family ATPase, partial [Flavobacteriales bacterium]|nr:AAA family ATPase [Flavobacteriales bacterium]
MIKKLIINNYAIINNLEIEFQKGFTTITGETGAGKSILLGALNLLLGTRFESINFKDKSKKSIIEGVFEVSSPEIEDFFFKHELDYDGEIIIRREFVFQGKSRSFINDTPVTLEVLKVLSYSLVDIHSQHENLLLNNNIFQINLLDQFCENHFQDFKKIISDYQLLFQDYEEIKIKIEKKQRLLDKDINVDYYKKVIQEIEEIRLDLSKKDKYEQELKKISNLHQIKKSISEAMFLLEESENSIISDLSSVISRLNTVKEYDLDLESVECRLKENSIDIQDIILDLHRLNNNLSLDTTRLDFLEERIDKINSLEKQFNIYSTQDLLLKIDDMEKQVHIKEKASSDLISLNNKLNNLYNQLHIVADNITFYRKKCSVSIIELLKNDLSNLGISYANIIFEFTKSEHFVSCGNDNINLMISFNKGHEVKPLLNIASGGEIARLMLAIKT